MNTNIFPVQSARLTLRRFQEKDLPAFVVYRSDPEIAEYQSWTSITDEEAREYIQRQQQNEFALPGRWFQVAIAQKETDVIIGDIGVCLRAVDPTCAEIGFTLSKENQGKGFASEAVRLMFKIIFDQTEVERIEGIVDSRNLASINLLSRLGMKNEKTEEVFFKGSLCTEYTFIISKTDWLTTNSV